MKYETNDAPIQDHELGFGPSPAEKLFARNQNCSGTLDDCDAAMTYDPEGLKVGIKAAWVNPDFIREQKIKQEMKEADPESIMGLVQGMKDLADKLLEDADLFIKKQKEGK